MQLADFHYDLPSELIAQEPPAERDGARMLVLHRSSQEWEDRNFRDLPDYLQPGDCLVLNDSRVLPSRLFGRRDPEGGAVEVMLLESDGSDWRALVRPGKRVRTGDRIRFDETLAARVVERGERGERMLRFDEGTDVYAALDRLGHMPLPPYIKRDDGLADKDRYQTVFARERGSVAAPTAGLHFTPQVLSSVTASGARTATVTLHVGLGTFQPIHREDFENHQLHFERYSVSTDAGAAIDSARRVVAVGTTSVRTLESRVRTGLDTGSTNLFIYPGYEFQRVGAMLTNFHLPGTSLLLLVCALAGTDFALAAYRHAVAARYRFFSYGDCMLIL